MPIYPVLSGEVIIFYQFYLLFPIEVNIARNSLHPSYSSFTFSQGNKFVSIITSNQYCVSLVSLEQL